MGRIAPTLAGELRKLEERARQRQRASDHSYRRSDLAEASGVAERTLDAWFDGRQVPQNLDRLMTVVDSLAAWAGPPAPQRRRWADLYAAARKPTAEAAQLEPEPPGRNGPARDPWWKKPAVWVAGIVASALAALLASLLTSGLHHFTATKHEPPRIPFNWTIARTSGVLNSCESWVFPQPASRIPPRTFGNTNADERWALRNHGTDIDNATWTITLQGITSEAVVIQDIRIRIVGKRPAVRGTQIASQMGCGGVVTVRRFSTALDSTDPHLSADSGVKSWPYFISRGDVEEVRLEADLQGYTDKNEYLFVYEIDWSQGDRTGTAEVHAPNGQPFAVTPERVNSPTYFIENGRWKSNNMGSG